MAHAELDRRYFADAVQENLVWSGGLSAVMCTPYGAVVLQDSTPLGPAQTLYEGGGVIAYSVLFSMV
jgi:hypothetical protein